MADDVFKRMRQLGDANTPAIGGGDDAFSRMRDRFGSSTADVLIPSPENPVLHRSLLAGATEGLQQMGDVVDPALSKLFGIEPNTEQRAKRRQEYESEFKNDAIAETGKIAGQVGVTSLFTPSATIAKAFKSAPAAAVLGTGWANKLGAAMTTGAVGGTVYGGATGQDIKGNAAAGAIGGPVIATAGKLGQIAIPGARSLMADINVINAAKEAGVDKSAIKNVIKILEDEGLTPAQAISELSALGKKGTIADLGPSITTEATGLATFGGKPTAILKGRFANRADEAGSEARKLIETRLGSRVDLEAEKQAIHDRASILTGPDYKAAKASGRKVDLSTLRNIIDNDLLPDTVGSQKATLNKIRGFLFDNKGNVKDTVNAAHNIRIELDNMLDKEASPLTSSGRNVKAAITNARNAVDAELKKIPEMAAADVKFEDHMKIKSGFQIGYDALTKKTNKDEFIKAFNAASPEMQDTIRKGARNAIWDVMEGSSRGEQGGITSLFNKKAVNQELLRTIYGTHGDSVIDAVHNEVAQRGTEQGVRFGSQTAHNLSIKQKYGKEAEPNFNDLGIGLAADAYGGGGAAVSAAVVKRGITNRFIAASEGRRERLAEGTADLLSRQGSERDVGMQVIDQIDKIQKRLGIATRTEKLLPYLSIPKTTAAPLGMDIYDRSKEQLLGRFRKEN